MLFIVVQSKHHSMSTFFKLQFMEGFISSKGFNPRLQYLQLNFKIRMDLHKSPQVTKFTRTII